MVPVIEILPLSWRQQEPVYGYWWCDDMQSRGISSIGIDLDILVYSDVSARGVKNFSTVGQSLPGKPPPRPHQRCPAEEAEAVVLAFLRCPGKGQLRAPLPAPALGDWSWDTVLWTVVVEGEPKRSNNEVLAWFFLVEEVDFVLVLLLSLGFWTKVIDEPTILSACRMAQTQFCRTLGSGPRTWGPSKGAVLTVLRTCGWKPKFLSRASCRIGGCCESCRGCRNLSFLYDSQLLTQ